MLAGRFWTVLDEENAMGKPGVFKRPLLDDGPLKELNDALHTLHLWAGRPSLTEMYAALSNEAKKKISRSTLHSALTGTGMPKRDTVDALVEILGARARNTTPEEQLPGFDALWQRAAVGEMSAEFLADVPADRPDLSLLLSQHLAKHPEDVTQTFTLVNNLRAAHLRDQERQMELISHLVDQGVITQADVDEVMKGVPASIVERPKGFRLPIAEV